ncbi:MAG: hypothetical protein VZQ83_09335, partial [Eubacterium sp.]|nr:hypothetical protein [Eubacterium sp.]
VALGYVSEIGRVYTITNNTDRTVLGTVDMVSYDTNGNVIYVNPMPIYLIAGASTEVKVPGLSAEMVSFEEIVRACSTT